jgi:hypothetical protein
VAHALERALNRLALGVENCLLERDVDECFHDGFFQSSPFAAKVASTI